MNRVLKGFYAATLAAGLVFGSAAGGNVMAKDRGKSGLPPGPGNPLASLQSQINQLSTTVNQLQTQINNLAPEATLLWINHLGLMADPADGLSVSQATAPLGGASGLLIHATIGAVADKGLEVGLQVPPGYKISKVNICYQVSGTSSISHINLSQLTSASTAANVLTDTTAKTSTTATCVDSAAAVTPVDPIGGPVRLNIGVSFANIIDQIVIRAIGLYLEPL
jgi:hypothetical protein